MKFRNHIKYITVCGLYSPQNNIGNCTIFTTCYMVNILQLFIPILPISSNPPKYCSPITNTNDCMQRVFFFFCSKWSLSNYKSLKAPLKFLVQMESHKPITTTIVVKWKFSKRNLFNYKSSSFKTNEKTDTIRSNHIKIPTIHT